LKPQPSTNDPRVVEGTGILMREDAADQYLSYKLIESNQDWKSKWFYICKHKRSRRSRAGSSRNTGCGGTPNPPCRRVSNYPN
jgi:hypothetical protein